MGRGESEVGIGHKLGNSPVSGHQPRALPPIHKPQSLFPTHHPIGGLGGNCMVEFMVGDKNKGRKGVRGGEGEGGGKMRGAQGMASAIYKLQPHMSHPSHDRWHDWEMYGWNLYATEIRTCNSYGRPSRNQKEVPEYQTCTPAASFNFTSISFPPILRSDLATE